MTADRFERALYVSVGLHAFILACVFLRAVVVPDQPIAIRNAIRVDVVGLPDKLPEMPKAEAPPSPKPEAKAEPAPKKPEPVAKPTPAPPPPKAPTVPTKNLAKNQKDALAKLKRANALQEIEQEVARQKAAAAAAKSAPIKGHQVSEGNSPTGLERLDYDRYFEEVKAKVFANYSLPQWLADAPLKTSIVVLIDERGFVTRKTVRRSSGNDVFDAKALEAVDASSPFAPPPARLRGTLSTNGLVFNFPEQ